MRAYKVLIDGRSAFTGWRWPLPDGDGPGEWVRASGPIGLCLNGVHACNVAQLAQWLGEELWVIELGGEILQTEPALVASCGRLLAPVSEWDADARRAFASDCAVRAREWASGEASSEQLLRSIDRFAEAGRAGPAGYWSAVLAGQRVAGSRSGPAYDDEFARERAAQSDWLRSELGLGL